MSQTKKNRRIRIQFDIAYEGSPGKEMDGESLTVPDMNLTVRQLLEASARGQEGQVKVKQPLYFETEIPTLNDITDVQRFREQLQDRLDQVNEFIKNEKKEPKKDIPETDDKTQNDNETK